MTSTAGPSPFRAARAAATDSERDRLPSQSHLTPSTAPFTDSSPLAAIAIVSECHPDGCWCTVCRAAAGDEDALAEILDAVAALEEADATFHARNNDREAEHG